MEARATFAERMRKASEFCLCFCYESEVLNDVYVCFMFEDLVLVESLKGDAHYAAWQRTGEVCDAIIAMVRRPAFMNHLSVQETYYGSTQGLHQGNKRDPDTPFFLTELRKKIFVSFVPADEK